jgi:Mg-chelatase subunit ChlD
MRKAVLVLVLVAAACASWPDSIDLIVMVDTSESMFRVFPDLVSYLLTDLLTKRLRFGDTFHLLTFADTPEVEISSVVDTEQSIERILRRLFLLKPLGSYTDLVAALKFLAAYTRELPEGNRKTILLLTDGVHDPPPDSLYRLDPEQVRRELFQTAQEIARLLGETTAETKVLLVKLMSLFRQEGSP